ncbi:acetyl-CoA C-acyltransferase [Streptomyces luteolifulvus]|uniref:acetyl-CoA C-acyltransferase n=1 Tax=Streptomyces luteolifulvus TaxID=2615112 RepID=A0A6H9UNT4_9ACTN|nr:acetyl-CoA C-acyltransferase [Streptomyces luteolifulvus]KAB1139644.1 acetyl-CoA C-acyltransferase [Streptomyces luteolifulvus]
MLGTYLVSATRTPIGRAVRGSLKECRPDDLVAGVIERAVRESGLDPELLDDHALGTAYPEGKQGSNLARRAGLLAGLPFDVPGATVNRFCASSLQAVRMASHAISSGEAEAYLVSGVESVSQVGRTTRKEDQHPALTESGIADVYIPMGVTAENVAERYRVSRDDMDALALRSHRLAVEAIHSGRTARQITPVVLPDGRTVSADDGPRRDTTLAKLAALPPVFREGGSVTAGNSCPLNDGAAAAVLVSERLAEREGLVPRARIVATAVSGVAPEIMGVGPTEAIRKVLRQASLTIEDIDVVEFNEAFAAQVLAVCRTVGIDIDHQLNPSGGAIALGHPFGMTGIRLLCSLLANLEHRSGRTGLATLCVGGGQGMALILERL